MIDPTATALLILVAVAAGSLGHLLRIGSWLPGTVRVPVTVLVGLLLHVLVGTLLLIAGLPTAPGAVGIAALLLATAIAWWRWPRPLRVRSLLPDRSVAVGGLGLGAVSAVIPLLQDEWVTEDSFDNLILGGLLAGDRVEAARVALLFFRPPALALLHGPAIATGETFGVWVAPLVGALLLWVLLGIIAQELRHLGPPLRATVLGGVATVLLSLPLFVVNLTYVNTHAWVALLVLTGCWSVTLLLRGGGGRPVALLGLVAAGLVVSRADGALYAGLLLVPLVAAPAVEWRLVRGPLLAVGSVTSLWWGWLFVRAQSATAGVPSGSWGSAPLIAGLGIVAVAVALFGGRSLTPHRRARLRPVAELLPLVLLLAALGWSPRATSVVVRRIGSALLTGQGGWTLVPALTLLFAVLSALLPTGRRWWSLRITVVTGSAMLLLLRVLERSPMPGGSGAAEGFEVFVWMESLNRAVLHLLPVALLLVVVTLSPEGPGPARTPTASTPRSPGRASLAVGGSTTLAVAVAVAGLTEWPRAGIARAEGTLAPDLGGLEQVLADVDRAAVLTGPLTPTVLAQRVVLAAPRRVELVSGEALARAGGSDATPGILVVPGCERPPGWGVVVEHGSVATAEGSYPWVAVTRGGQDDPVLPALSALGGEVDLPYEGRDGPHGVARWLAGLDAAHPGACNPAALGLLEVAASSVMEPSAVTGPLSHGSLRGLFEGWDWGELLHTVDGGEGWFEVRLPPGTALELRGVTVRQRTDDEASLVRGFRIEVADDAGSWRTVLRARHSGGRSERQYFPVASSGSPNARIVRLIAEGENGSGGTALVLGELELYGRLAARPGDGGDTGREPGP